MESRNPWFAPPNQPKSGTPAGGSTAIKGDSSAPPADPDATLIELPHPVPDPDATMMDLDLAAAKASRTTGPSLRPQATPAMLQEGDVLGGRYEILQLLGEGGMGSVYKAMDRELNRPVALKLIRPELASNPSILARFKQELLLARQVTHRNVIRIFDLGDADGVKFITMEFVDGHDLRVLLKEKKKFSPEEAVEIIEQACRALEAAHNAGVLHRDLKPHNIMRDETGRVLVMDFGLARTLDGDGMTQTGALLGTMEYMSPEQALAQDLDQRSDIFTMGLILYELITGEGPYRAESAVASLLKRTSQRAIPASDRDGTIPRTLSNIVSKCLERDPALRYQTVSELLRDLDAWQGKTAAANLGFQPAVEPWGRTIHWPLVSGVAVAILLGILGYIFRGPLFSSSAKPAPAVSLAILPFRNASGDPSLDWLGASLSDMLSTDVGQSAHLHAISQDRLHQLFADLRISSNSSIDPTTLRRLAEFSNADTIVWGQYASFGGQIRIDATLQDLKHDRSVPIKVEGVDQKDIPSAVDRLATSIRQNLAFSADVVQELKASSFQPSSTSADALRNYSLGVQFLRDGKNLEAIKAFDSACQSDPTFALAYARLADADSDLGYDGNAEQAARKAVELSAQLPSAEKYLIQATQARIARDNKRAIEAYENLARSMPDNSDVELSLASLYTETGNYDAARAQLSKLLTSDPKNIKALWQMGVVEIVGGNPQAALDPLNKGLSLSVQVDAQELKALILQSMGISYRMMNKPDEAMRNYQDAMAINKKLGLNRALASNLVEIAVLQNSQGKADAALDDYRQALELQRAIGMKKEIGDTLIDMGAVYQSRGDYDKALENYKESLQIQRDAGDENYQALCLNNIGGVYMGKGENDNALIYLQQALQLREKLNSPAGIAETLSSLGQVYITTGQYDQAMTTAMRALELYRKAGNTRGAADESHDIGMIFEHQGRFGAAVTSLQDSVTGYRNAGDRSSDMVGMLTDLADALALAGRAAESEPLLREAQDLARTLKNDSVQAALLRAQADVRRYTGNSAAAGSLYQQALQAATRNKDLDEILLCKLKVAEVLLDRGASSALEQIRTLKQDADNHNLKYLSLEGSVDIAQSLSERRSYAQAGQELQDDLGKSERLGTRFETARIQYLLGKTLVLSGKKPEAAEHFRAAVAAFEEMAKDPGAEKLLARPDLKVMLAEASRLAPAAK